MTLQLEQPPCYQSLVGRFDPRWKLAALVVAAVAVALLQTLPAALLALVLAVALVQLASIPWRWYLRRVAGLTLLLFLFVVWLPWLVPDVGRALDLGPLQVSVPGVVLALTILCKGLGVVTLMLVLWVTAPLETTAKAAYCLHMPGLVVQLVILTHRYVFLLGEELGRLRIALRVRGYRNRANVHSYRTIGHVTGALVIRGYERAERVSQAMRCRGFDGHFRSLAVFQTRAADVCGFLAIVASAAGLLLLDLL